MGTSMILNFRQTPPRESKRLSIMPFQTRSTKQSEVAEFGITRLIHLYEIAEFQLCPTCSEPEEGSRFSIFNLTKQQLL